MHYMFLKFFFCGFVSHSSSVNDVLVEPESSEDKENDDPGDADGKISRLWVDRFSPRHYTELLSDDVSFLHNFTYTPTLDFLDYGTYHNPNYS